MWKLRIGHFQQNDCINSVYDDHVLCVLTIVNEWAILGLAWCLTINPMMLSLPKQGNCIETHSFNNIYLPMEFHEYISYEKQVSMTRPCYNQRLQMNP